MEKRLHYKIFTITLINVFIQEKKCYRRKSNYYWAENILRPFFSWEQTCNTEIQISPKGYLMMKTLRGKPAALHIFEQIVSKEFRLLWMKWEKNKEIEVYFLGILYNLLPLPPVYNNCVFIIYF